MSGYDKYELLEELRKRGWADDPERGEYMVRPPPGLIERMSKMSFHVYDAADLCDYIELSESAD